MNRRRPTGRHLKKHRTYEIGELARRLGVHPNTVRRWIRNDGLAVIDDRRPALIKGDAAKAFLDERWTSKKQKLQPGELYCVRCRDPKGPHGNLADYRPLGPEHGYLQGLCPDCGTLINRCVSLARLDAVCGELDVALPQALQRIRESA